MKALTSVGYKKIMAFLWYSWYAWLIHVSLPPIRVWLLRLAGASVGADSVILDVKFTNLYHYGFSRLRIGSRCFLGDEVMLDVRGGITLADDVTVSNRVTIVSHINVGYPDHPLQSVYPTREAVVLLERGVYIGTAATILPGVTLGHGSVVGAGAVVTKSVPADQVVVGVPARFLKKAVHKPALHR